MVRPSAAGPSVRVRRGSRLLAGIEAGQAMPAGRSGYRRVAVPSLEDLVRLTEEVGLRGRGGAGFPFAVKLRAASSGRRGVVVVNWSEGEPASFKDAALALTRPHLVLDGAVATAGALKTRQIHLVLPEEHEIVQEQVRSALAERNDPVTWRMHLASQRFVAGQARAVVELISGRPNLPVTAWEPEAVRGYRNRPTLLSNAETFAQVAVALELGPERYAALGADGEPGTTLLTLHGESRSPLVLEVPYGTPWRTVLTEEELCRPILLGGYHGAWVAAGALVEATISRAAAATVGAGLGAGIVLPLARAACPLTETARISGYLAQQSAGRCGPCFHGLPALAEAAAALDRGADAQARILELAHVLPGRGACAHPDGTVRMVTSAVRLFGAELARHRQGLCSFADQRWGRTA